MKKKYIIIIVLIILAVLFIPIKFTYRDGGTVEYKALTYAVKKVHKVNLYSETGYDNGIVIEILGIQVYNNVIITEPPIEANTVENVSMSIKEGTITNTGVTIIITDTNVNKHGFDEWFRIDKKTDNGWEEAKIINYDYVVNAIAYNIGESGVAELKVNWKDLYGELEKGQYRIVKKLNGDRFSAIQVEFEIQDESTNEFNAKIKEISKYNGITTILIEGLETNDINHRGEFEFSIDTGTEILWIEPESLKSSYTSIDLSKLKKDQNVSITSIGDVLESYPARLTKVTKIVVLDEEL